MNGQNSLARHCCGWRGNPKTCRGGDKETAGRLFCTEQDWLLDFAEHEGPERWDIQSTAGVRIVSLYSRVRDIYINTGQ